MDNQVAMVTLLQHSNNISSTAPSSVSDSAAAGGALSRAGHTAAAVVLGFILVLGFLSNFLVLLVFSRFHWLRTPAKLLLINISASDMFVCIFGTPISFAASVRGGWLTGSYGCRWYGFSNALFGECSSCYLEVLMKTECGSMAYYLYVNGVEVRDRCEHPQPPWPLMTPSYECHYIPKVTLT